MTNVVTRSVKTLFAYVTYVILAILKILQDRYFGYEKVTDKESFYDLVDKNMNKEDVLMSSFKGDVLLVVNVASK